MTNARPTEPERATSATSSSGPIGTGMHAEGTTLADTDSGRIGTLRGASVGFNPHRLVQVVVGLVMVGLAVSVIVLTLAGVHSNSQINRLHTQGQPVTFTVTGCLGLLGGSGSNAAGYSCKGTYTLDGHTYTEPLPGSTFYRPGTKVPSVAVPGDGALVSPAAIIDSQQASNGVFIVPTILGVILLGLTTVVVVRNRPKHRTPAAGQVSSAAA